MTAVQRAFQDVARTFTPQFAEETLRPFDGSAVSEHTSFGQMVRGATAEGAKLGAGPSWELLHVLGNTDPWRRLARADVVVLCPPGVALPVPVESVPALVLAEAYRRFMVMGLTSEKEWLDQVQQTVALATRILREERVELRWNAGIANLELRRDVSLPWGSLRRATKYEYEQMERTIGRGAGAVLEGRWRVKARLDTSARFPEQDIELRHERDTAIAKTLLTLRLADRLPITRDTPRLCLAYVEEEMPFAGGELRHLPVGEFVDSAQRVQLDGRRCGVLERIGKAVARYYRKDIEVAVRRITEIAKRWDAGDRFLDLMIALENLHGEADTQAEVTFRIRLSVARALEVGEEKRADLAARVKKLYQARSTIVHGGSIPSSSIHSMADEAETLVLRSLRKFLVDRPDLVASKHRWKKLLL